MQSQLDKSLQYNSLPYIPIIAPGEYVFRPQPWLMSAQLSTAVPAVVKPFKLRLSLPPTIEDEFAAWDQLSDEALLGFEASLE